MIHTPNTGFDLGPIWILRHAAQTTLTNNPDLGDTVWINARSKSWRVTFYTDPSNTESVSFTVRKEDVEATQESVLKLKHYMEQKTSKNMPPLPPQFEVIDFDVH